MRVLVVTDPFEGYSVGDRIEDARDVERIEASPNAARTVAVNAPDPAPKKGGKGGKDEPEA